MEVIEQRLNLLKNDITEYHETHYEDTYKSIEESINELLSLTGDRKIVKRDKSLPSIKSFDKVSKKRFFEMYPKNKIVVQKTKLVDNNNVYIVLHSQIIYPTMEIYNKYKDIDFKPIIEHFNKGRKPPSQLHMEFESLDPITNELELYRLEINDYALVVDYI